MVFIVSKIPGVSTMTIFLLNLTADLCEQTLVIDVPESDDLNASNPRIEFPVALFPDPVFPKRTNRSSLSLLNPSPKSQLTEKKKCYLNCYLKYICHVRIRVITGFYCHMLIIKMTTYGRFFRRKRKSGVLVSQQICNNRGSITARRTQMRSKGIMRAKFY